MAGSVVPRANNGNVERRKTRKRKGGVHRTLRECGKLLGISPQAVEQTERRALAKLRRAILKDAEFSAMAAELFGDGILDRPEPLPPHIEVRPGGYFDPKWAEAKLPQPQPTPAAPTSKPEPALDVAAYLVETLRVLGIASMTELEQATELPLATIATWLRELCDRGLVTLLLQGRRGGFVLTEGRVIH